MMRKVADSQGEAVTICTEEIKQSCRIFNLKRLSLKSVATSSGVCRAWALLAVQAPERALFHRS